MTDAVRFEKLGAAGIITLARPEALNAINTAMVEAIAARLEAWRTDRGVERVVIEAVPGRAFCAGGDLKEIFDKKQAADPRITDFYRKEYMLNRTIRTYPKPYVALIDGMVMGGGAGLSVHGSHCIGTENTRFAMPETAIGFFPDIGASWFLSRLPGHLGEYLGLTGTRIGIADALDAGLMSHHVLSERLARLRHALTEPGDTHAIVLRHARRPEESPALAPVLRSIDRAFVGASMRDILTVLAAWPEDDDDRAWAVETLDQLGAASPLSLAVTLQMLTRGRLLDFDECLKQEFRIASRIMMGHDFFEGVRARLIDKGAAPTWWPGTLAEISPEMIERHFAPIASELRFDDA